MSSREQDQNKYLNKYILGIGIFSFLDELLELWLINNFVDRYIGALPDTILCTKRALLLINLEDSERIWAAL